MKTFTLEEAQSLLPLVSSLLEKALEANGEATRLAEKLSRLKVRIFHSGGMTVNVAAAFRDAEEGKRQTQLASAVLGEIADIGVQVHDLERGLLDFPATLDGERVLLCWRRGEAEIGYWRNADEEWALRRRLDERLSGMPKSERPN